MRSGLQILVIICLMCLGTSSAMAQYVARKTRVDPSRFPVMKVYVSITDSAGNPIPDDQSVDIAIREDGKLVSKELLATGYSFSSVLVLDVSGSMEGDKLTKAKEAAINYVTLAQRNHSIAIVTFSDTVHLVSDFTNDKAQLQWEIRKLTAGGGTALQEGAAKALEILQRRTDRRMILLLTDGKENQGSGIYAGEGGLKKVIQTALNEECTLSVVGLGSDVKEDYLKKFEETHGRYLKSPTSAELTAIFGTAVKLLQKERVFTYTTANPDPNGTQRSITVELVVGGKGVVDTNPTLVTVYGLLPHVAGDHTAYVILLLALLMGPSLVVFLRSFLKVYNFRKTRMTRVSHDSLFIGRRDLNDGPEQGFAEGDILIVCPVSETPHHVRCWRYNKCRCFHDNSAGPVCYHRTFPPSLRRFLDFVFSERISETGRTWLCRCAGDQEGC
jgi:uncharacterized protein YegL